MIKNCFFSLCLLTTASFIAPAILAADLEAGKAKARMCQNCHGKDGISQLPHFPKLAGQHAIYLAKQLKAFRDGERQNENMTVAVQNLTDEDIEDLAAYYESLGNSCDCQ